MIWRLPSTPSQFRWHNPQKGNRWGCWCWTPCSRASKDNLLITETLSHRLCLWVRRGFGWKVMRWLKIKGYMVRVESFWSQHKNQELSLSLSQKYGYGMCMLRSGCSLRVRWSGWGVYRHHQKSNRCTPLCITRWGQNHSVRPIGTKCLNFRRFGETGWKRRWLRVVMT